MLKIIRNVIILLILALVLSVGVVAVELPTDNTESEKVENMLSVAGKSIPQYDDYDHETDIKIIQMIDRNITSSVEEETNTISALLLCESYKNDLLQDVKVRFSDSVCCNEAAKFVAEKYEWLEEYQENLIQTAEYSEATEIWFRLKTYGYSDEVCAAIMGNIMAEVGGHTLDVQPIWYVSGFYGMCMWSTYYYPEAKGLTIEEQCEFLRNTMQKELDYAGFCYSYNFGYDEFLEMTDYQDAALAFAKCYERCGSGSYYMRQVNAEIAYNYFVGE